MFVWLAEDTIASSTAEEPDTLLGWFVCRGGTHLSPSLREQVTSHFTLTNKLALYVVLRLQLP